MPPREPEVGRGSCTVGPAAAANTYGDDYEKIMNGRTISRSTMNVPKPISRKPKGVSPAATAGAAAGVEIPWRTSRRLQEATFRLLQERDGGNLQSHQVGVATDADAHLAARSPKKRQSSPGQHRADEEEQSKEGKAASAPVARHASEGGSKSQNGQKRRKASEAQVTGHQKFGRKLKKRKKRKFHVSNSPHLGSDGRKGMVNTESLRDADETKIPIGHIKTEPVGAAGSAGVVSEPGITHGSGSPIESNNKQPQSCFDLLCKHVGFRGWRCYRSIIAGQSFCIYHQVSGNQLKSTPSAAGISICT